MTVDKAELIKLAKKLYGRYTGKRVLGSALSDEEILTKVSVLIEAERIRAKRLINDITWW